MPSKKFDPSTYVEVPDQSAPRPATVNPSDVTRVVTPTQTVFTTDYRYRIISGVSPSQASTKPSHMIAHLVIANVVCFDTHFVRQDGFASEKTASERFFDADVAAATELLLKGQIVKRWYYDDAPARDDIGDSPSIEQIMNILENSRFYSDVGYYKASWNQVIYGEVLRLAVPLPCRGSEGTVSYVPWGPSDMSFCPSRLMQNGLTAKMIDYYVDTGGFSRKIDYSMLIKPEAPYASAIQELRY
ncbi:AT hook domain-containing protein [Colletotrichum cuscutae]|uniref:AT hook domain-containing protein n=1 Tax=Colletotrichum cuscutae TaxID=1209917 RepID=A0AAI9YA42_9PEZI|nr:AT hook domain-containing protein [Colletotrichum cuscutae]